jgi:F0F1-type ATP synthase epsilon subunit
MEVINLLITSPAGSCYSAPVWQVTARNCQGLFSIRAHHCAFVTTIEAGVVEVAETPERRRKYRIEPGVLRVSGDTCAIMCEGAAEVSPAT